MAGRYVKSATTLLALSPVGQTELLSGEAKHGSGLSGADAPMRSASHLLHCVWRDVAFSPYDLSPDPRFCGHTRSETIVPERLFPLQYLSSGCSSVVPVWLGL